MKKIIIILSLIFPLGATQAITVDEIVGSAQNLWKKEIVAPNFSITDTQGNTHTHESTKGKYLVVNFWATWCPPCLKEIPDFIEFYEKHADKVEILGLDYEDADQEVISNFSDTYMINYPIILFDEKNSSQFKVFGEIIGMPTTFIYDPKGKLIKHHMGELDIKTLEKLIL